MAVDDLQSKAADLVKKVITVGVGAIFLTEESVRSLVSEFKLPKEFLSGVLEAANKSKNEFLQGMIRETVAKFSDKVDPRLLLEEFLRNNEIKVSITFAPKKED